jgi:hypothetical protein
MWRTTGKNGMPTGWVIVANVDGDEIRRLQLAAETLHGDVGLLRHPEGITFAISRIDAGKSRYTFVLPLVGREVLEMLRMLHVTGFRVAFSCGTKEVFRYALPVAADAVGELLTSHLRRYSRESVLLAASDVATNFLKRTELVQPGSAHPVCVIATPELQTWAARRHRNE